MYETLPVSDNRSAYDKVQDFLCEGDNDAARKGQETIGTLRRVVALKRHADLHDAPAENDKTDSTDKAEDEITEIVDYGDGIAAGRKSGHAASEYQCKGHYQRRVGAEALLDFDRHISLVLVFSAHFSFPPSFCVAVVRVPPRRRRSTRLHRQVVSWPF